MRRIRVADVGLLGKTQEMNGLHGPAERSNRRLRCEIQESV